jgi:hypothetical protein
MVPDVAALPQDQAKICKICCMQIPAAAKKCPYCHQWQYWLSTITFHPLFGLVIVGIPFIVLIATFASLQQNLCFRGEPFQKYAKQVAVIESKVEFGQDKDKGPVVAVVGVLKNSSSIDWKDIRFQVEFFDPKGKLFDAGQEHEFYSPRVPPGEQIAFKITFPRQFPEKEYASHKIRIISATDGRQRF